MIRKFILAATGVSATRIALVACVSTPRSEFVPAAVSSECVVLLHGLDGSLGVMAIS